MHWRRSENKIPAGTQPPSAAAPAPPLVPLDKPEDDGVHLALATLFGTVPPTLPASDEHRPVPFVNMANMCWMHAALQARSGLPISSTRVHRSCLSRSCLCEVTCGLGLLCAARPSDPSCPACSPGADQTLVTWRTNLHKLVYTVANNAIG